ncbi:Sodium/potassium-transporting ATPase subunit beta-2 [Habropoda laboriosa]|uniref:Sodium/potassium-transporting ATPase subunit beta-2 n=1 Tax=Habropoda laboriosa TaxID=597456 RepID=A0A0L7QPH2_9HYME|nr:Sodium/potassium-transporting ATPase subunit beta-2 [Habropoda laboriosa]
MSVLGKQLQNGTYEFDYNRAPEQKTNWKAFRDYIHNPAEGTYCGHTGKKWAITGIFYTCFFAVLALLFAICMKGLLATINTEKPRWILEESLIGTNPGPHWSEMLANSSQTARRLFVDRIQAVAEFSSRTVNTDPRTGEQERASAQTQPENHREGRIPATALLHGLENLAILRYRHIFTYIVGGIFVADGHTPLLFEGPQSSHWSISDSGLGFRPISEIPEEKSLIWYSSSDPSSVQKWTGLLDKFLEEYVNSSLLPNGGRNQQICNYNTPVKPGHVCAVEVNNWGPCSPNQQYGFNNSAPCVFIKLNRIYGWIPECYNSTNDLPSDMPASLVQHIKSVNSSRLNTIWVSCAGEDPHDHENIGEINYYPEDHGFPGYYYPYKNIPGYLSPVVAVHFLRPARNRIISVECRAWAKNIKYSPLKLDKLGSVHFELMVDE